jgi:glutaminyl-peptide cyclotransferase
MRKNLVLALGLVFLMACREGKKENTPPDRPPKIITVPDFNADSAYFFIKKQVDFGPRIPNTSAHRKAGDYFINTFKRFGARVTIQEFEQPSFDGEKLALRNIIASYFPDKQKRILIAAHWDTRPFADKDEQNPNSKFEGANDGGSGVGVALEIARVISLGASPDVGVDIILFDGEDWGEKNGNQGTHPLPPELKEWWCLGSQYWASHKHQSTYAAYYGILLDMVGAADAQFYREGFSQAFAPTIVEKVWNTAGHLGFGHIFIKRNKEEITDDHLFVNSVAKIPMIDIINFDPANGSFGSFHHTRKDNLSIISRNTLKAVGETVLNVIYYEE